MNFKQSVKQAVDAKYADMINESSATPYANSPNIQSYDLYLSKQEKYHNRLKREKSAFQMAGSVF